MQQKSRAGAPGVHCGEPGELTPTNEQSQPLDPFDIFTPWATEDERALRRRVHRAQGAARAKAERSKHGRARTLYWLSAQLASHWVFARAPVTDLSEILAALSRLFLTAGAIERLEGPDEC